ncbi:MAG: hypothetical protein H7Z74_06045 [Anaerolineae bacterium]|nr:hypothetical protein [Gemmatimonadaceae bacterium]
MTKLHSLVQAYVAPPGTLGAPIDSSDPSQQSIDRSSLKRELARLRQGREVAFWICFVALLTVFTLSMMYLVQHRDNPAAIAKMSTATGVTLLGVVGIMTKLWQDKIKADLVLAIVSGASEESLKDALRQLLDKL